MMSVNETTCVATVHVQISPPFFGWMAQFGNRMRVLLPDSAAKKYSEHARNIVENTELQYGG